MLRCVLAWLLLGGLPIIALAGDDETDVAPTADEERVMRASEALGLRIFAHDRAAAVATDAMLEVRGFKRDRRLQGWITEDRGENIVVTFIGAKKKDTPAALYRVEVDRVGTVSKDPVSLVVPEPLSPFERAAFAARSLALSARLEPCAKKYNAVVLPQDDQTNQWRVYLLPATTESQIVPIGGTYRFDVSTDTGEIDSRPYTRSCLQLDSPPEATALMASHLLDPVPTEVHVFWSLWAQKPIYIATTVNGSLWLVDGAKIELKRRKEG